MIIKPEHAAAVEKARSFAHGCKMRALNSDLEPNFVAHAFVAEAMKLWFEDCDNARAQALASGFMVLAFADQNTTQDGMAIADYVLSRTVNEPEVVDRFRRLAGLVVAK